MEVVASCTFEAPASAVWGLLEDFTAIQHWWPEDGAITIAKVECEGEGGVDTIRHIYNNGISRPVSERLDFIDADNKTLILSIVGNRPKGIKAYVAIGKVVELSESECRLEYRGFVTTDPGLEKRTEDNVRFTWERMFEGLRRYVC